MSDFETLEMVIVDTYVIMIHGSIGARIEMECFYHEMYFKKLHAL